jgi:hypothetical protein
MSPRRAGAISPLLVLIAEALAADRRQERPGEGAALRELGALARVQVPARGVLAPSDDALYNAIDQIAMSHLDLGIPRKALGAALAGVEPFTKRDEIEVAVNHLSAVLDVAYFNAGLAFGVTFADLRTIR